MWSPGTAPSGGSGSPCTGTTGGARPAGSSSPESGPTAPNPPPYNAVRPPTGQVGGLTGSPLRSALLAVLRLRRPRDLGGEFEPGRERRHPVPLVEGRLDRFPPGVRRGTVDPTP